MKNLIKAFSFILILIVFISCHKDKTTPPPVFTDNGDIGVEGGTVRTNDGASVEIPSGVLSTNKTISITNVTKEDTIANNGCRIYELKPDGLKFTDSVMITLPFDGTHLDINSQEENFGVSIIVYQDTTWVKLKAKIDTKSQTISAKTIHFSTYVVSYPENYADYFRKNKLNHGNLLIVPHYCQGISNWCAFYSLSMVSRYAGYNYKGPMFASLFGKTSFTGFNSGLNLSFNLPFIGKKIAELGISSEDVYPPWVNGEELGGYILKKLDKGQPVWVCNNSLHHVFVVTGHSANGFFINDPSGALFTKVFGVDPWSPFNLTTILVSYSQFVKTVKDFSSTLVISSQGNRAKTNVTLNFLPGGNSIWISDSNGAKVGDLEINGKHKPDGYALINKMNTNVFNGTDFITILPLFSNSDGAIKTVNFNYKIDNKDVSGSPIMIEIPASTSLFNTPSDQNTNIILKKFQLSNLAKGNHTLSLELTSITDPNLKYDSYDFLFQIETANNITIPSVATTPVTIFSSSSATVGGNITLGGGAAVTERGVYWGTLQNPETTGTKLQVGSGIGAFTSNLSGLTPNTPYYVKAYAINSQGPAYGIQVSFTTPPSGGQTGTVTDIDGNIYNTIVIGTQEWMAENLKTSKYNNRDVIPTDLSNAAWNTTTSGAYAIYNNDNANNAVYGKLYNFYSVVDSRNLCPTGWHVPNKSEYDQLLNYLGGIQNAYSKLIQGGSSGVNITFGGNRDYPGNFAGIGTEAIIWSSSNPRWYLDLSSSNQNITWYTPISTVSSNRGYSIRCVQGVVTSGTIPTNGLVAYYPFNGNANDISGNGYNGTANGAITTTDRFSNANSAYSFADKNTIDMGNILSDLFVSNNYSLSLWYNKSTSNNGGLLNKWQNCCPNTGNNAFWGVPTSFVSNSQSSPTLSSAPINTWVHWVVVMNSGTLQFYIDGVLKTTQTGHSSVASNKNLMISSPQGVGNSFIGKVDDVRIYNRAITADEVQALYHEGGW